MIPSLTLSEMKILIVDDEPANVALLEYMLAASGYGQFRSTMDPRQAMNLFREFHPDLVLLDLMMPHINGFEIMRQLAAETTPDACVPILVLTADVSVETKHQALLVGASDFLTKPFDHVEVLLRIRHLLLIRAQHLQLTQERTQLEEDMSARTVELRETHGHLAETHQQLRSTQQQVIQHERMSALGSMAAGLAHDFNNALSLILGYGELLRGELTDSPHKDHSDEYLGTIITAATDAARMFDRLRGFYRPANDEQFLEPLDLNGLVVQAAAFTRPRWHGEALAHDITIKLDLDLCPGLPLLLADGSELREMLTNLIFNAVDATPAPGGTITLRTRAPGEAGGAVLLEVSDTGSGMSEETRRRCLEPFFSTKGDKGTGLGLSMVYGTVQRHGGSIALESAPGEGTTFRFTLPVREWTAADSLAPVAEGAFPWSILVVDDELEFLKALQGYLAKGGLEVETAHGSTEAVEKFRARPFDLVITDKAMPGMGGEELARTVKSHNPQTRVIMLTGYSMTVVAESNRSGAVDLTILKPVTLAALRAAIGQVMVGRQPLQAPLPKRRRRTSAWLPG